MEIDVALDENERRAIMQSSNLIEALERIAQIRLNQANTAAERQRIIESTKNIQKDNELKQLDIDLKEKGVQPSDNIFLRVISRILEKYVPETEDEKRNKYIQELDWKKKELPAHGPNKYMPFNQFKKIPK